MNKVICIIDDKLERTVTIAKALAIFNDLEEDQPSRFDLGIIIAHLCVEGLILDETVEQCNRLLSENVQNEHCLTKYIRIKLGEIDEDNYVQDIGRIRNNINDAVLNKGIQNA